jgi:hypothetical protein
MMLAVPVRPPVAKLLDRELPARNQGQHPEIEAQRDGTRQQAGAGCHARHSRAKPPQILAGRDRTALRVVARLQRRNRCRIGGRACQKAMATAFRAEIHRLAFEHLTRGSGGRIDRHPAHRVDNHLLRQCDRVRCRLYGSMHFLQPCLQSLHHLTISPVRLWPSL